MKGPEVVFEARVFKTREDVEKEIYTNGFAREVEGKGNVMINGTSHVENAECLPLRSEILTRSGFRTYDTLVIGEEVAAYDLESDTLVWTPLRRVVVYPDAAVVRVGNKSRWHFTCTPDHSWAIQRKLWKRTEPRMVKTTELLTSDTIVHAAYEPKGGDSPLTPEEAATLGWMVTDGHIHRSGNCVRGHIYQSKPLHIPRIRELVGAVAREDYREAGVRTFPTGQTYETLPSHRWELPARVTRELLEKAGFNTLADLPRIAANLSPAARSSMLEAFLQADADARGAFGKGKPEVMEAFQVLATLEGKGLGAYRMSSGDVIPVQTLKKCRLVCASEFETVPGGVEDVWCPTTDFGTWVTRQDGNVTITGNTSAIGRALANMGYGTAKNRASRSEMVKVARMEADHAEMVEWLSEQYGLLTGEETGTVDGEEVVLRDYIEEQADAIRAEYRRCRVVVQALGIATGRVWGEEE